MKFLNDDEANFCISINAYSERIYRWAQGKGFWEDKEKRNKGELIALMHSELSEALEALRKNDPPDNKIPEFSGTEAELADCIIRILDYSAAFNLRIGEAIVAKMQFNDTRPHKHGKEF